MRKLMANFETNFAAKIGRCTFCMRQSLLAAASACGVFAVTLWINADGVTQSLTGLAALGLTGLWIAHVATYAARAVAEAPRREPVARTQGGDAPIGRRRAIGLMLRAAGAGAAASVPLVLWPSASFAFCGQCTRNSDCGVGFVCRNTAPVNSGKVCNECVRG